MSDTSNFVLKFFRAKLIEKSGGDYSALTDSDKSKLAKAFADVFTLNYLNHENK